MPLIIKKMRFKWYKNDFLLVFRPKNRHFTFFTHVKCNYLKTNDSDYESHLLLSKFKCIKILHISPQCQLKDAELSKDSSAGKKKNDPCENSCFFRTQLTLLYCAYIYSTGIK